MRPSPPNQVTALLARWSQGEAGAREALVPLVYEELRRLARGCLAERRRDHTLQSTALVDEAYLRLVGRSSVHWRDRVHFFAVAARLTRGIPVDHPRIRSAANRGGEALTLTLDESIALPRKKSWIWWRWTMPCRVRLCLRGESNCRVALLRRAFHRGHVARAWNLSRNGEARMGDGKNIVTARNEPLRARMNPEPWQQVKSLLATALESHPSQRCAYLDQACGEDRLLREELENLLSIEPEADPELLNNPSAMLSEVEEGLAANSRIGRRHRVLPDCGALVRTACRLPSRSRRRICAT